MNVENSAFPLIYSRREELCVQTTQRLQTCTNKRRSPSPVTGWTSPHHFKLVSKASTQLNIVQGHLSLTCGDV